MCDYSAKDFADGFGVEYYSSLCEGARVNGEISNKKGEEHTWREMALPVWSTGAASLGGLPDGGVAESHGTSEV